MSKQLTTAFSFALTMLLSFSTLASSMYTTYQAKIIKPDGAPLESTNVNFRFTILDPLGSCVLYTENFNTINMAGTGGLVYFSLGSGIKTFPVSGSVSFSDVFNNQGGTLSCEVGGPPSYTPTVNDLRKIVMQFHDGTGWQTLPAMNINHVPYAMYAKSAASATTAVNSTQLNGKTDLDFVQVTSIPTCSASQALQFNGASFGCVAVGGGSTVTSSDVTTALGYTPANSATVSTLQSNLSTVSAATNNALTKANNLSDLTNVATARTNLGLGAMATVNSLSASDVTTALGYTPQASGAISSQWITNGSGIYYSSGNVGIGTATPAHSLDIEKSGTGSYTGAKTTITSTSGNATGFDTVVNGSNYSTGVLVDTQSTLASVGIDVYASVTTSGGSWVRGVNVGIDDSLVAGTGLRLFAGSASTTPSKAIHISSGYNAGYAVYADTNGKSYFKGNVGVGTATPRAPLDVSGNVTVGELAANNALVTIYTRDSGSVSHGLALIDRAAGYGSWQNPSGLDGVSADSSGTITGWGQLYFNYYSSGNIDFNNGGGHSKFKGSVAVGMGTAPTARLHVGTGTSSTAPLKFTSGPLLTTPQPGAVEYDGSNYYFTDATSTRRSISSIAASATSVAGSSGHVQYNNAGSLGASSNFRWNTTENSLNVGPANSFTGSGLAVANQFVLDLAAKDYKFVEWSGNMALVSCINASCNSYSMLASFDPVNGSFGVGTNPAAKLHVNGAGGAATLLLNNNALGSLVTNGVLLSADTTGFEINNQHSSAMTFKTASTERMRITAAGNVGIGTTSPNYPLTVNGAVVAGPGSTAAPAYMFYPTTTYGATGMYAPAANVVGFTTAAGERMRIDASGNVGIGTTTPATRLDVVGDIQYTGTITDVSDRRLKTNIASINSALSTIRKIKTYSYVMKDDPQARTEYGVMAQDMLGIIPNLVKNIDTRGEYYGVNYMGLIPWSIRALQEVDSETQQLRRENTEIKRELASLKEKHEALEQKLEKILQALEQQKHHGEKK